MTRKRKTRSAEVRSALRRKPERELGVRDCSITLSIKRPTRCANRFNAPCDRDREDPPLVDFHLHFFESRGAHQFVHLRGGTTAHDPRLAFAIAQHPRNEFHLRMPRLVCVHEMTAGLDRTSHSTERN